MRSPSQERFRKKYPKRECEYARKAYKNNTNKFRERSQEWKKNNPLYHRGWHLKKRHGLSLEAYDQMLEDQGGQCYLCGDDGKNGQGGRLYVDHDHKTESPRKLLCRRCNSVLGFVGDSTMLLEKMIGYLNQF